MSLNLDYFKTTLNGIRQYVQGVQKKLEKDTDKKIKDNTPDWNQNDPEGKGYIQNRPFYTEDPIPLGKVTFTATSETKMTHTITEDDIELLSSICALTSYSSVLKIKNSSFTYMLDVLFDRGWFTFFIDGIVIGSAYYNVGREWYLNIGNTARPLIAGKTYKVDFLSTADTVKVIPVEYMSSEIFEQSYSPIKFGTKEDSTVLGTSTTASNVGAHAQGFNTTASGTYSHAEGIGTIASGAYSHAEGYYTTASDTYSHAEGAGTTASNIGAHAEGEGTTASNIGAHAEGIGTTASGSYSHASGRYNILDSEPYGYTISSDGHIVIPKDSTDYLYTSSISIDLKNGKFISNPKETAFSPTASAKEIYIFKKQRSDIAYFIEGIKEESSSNIYYKVDTIELIKTTSYNYRATHYNYATIVGNGLSSDRTSNAHTLDWSGNAWFSGDVYVGSTSGTNKDDGSKKLATEEYVDNRVSESGSDTSLGLTGVSAGQVLVIKTVDDTGKPTEYEAKDFYTKTQIDNIMGSYITDIDSLIGGV